MAFWALAKASVVDCWMAAPPAAVHGVIPASARETHSGVDVEIKSQIGLHAMADKIANPGHFFNAQLSRTALVGDRRIVKAIAQDNFAIFQSG